MPDGTMKQVPSRPKYMPIVETRFKPEKDFRATFPTITPPSTNIKLTQDTLNLSKNQALKKTGKLSKTLNKTIKTAIKAAKKYDKLYKRYNELKPDSSIIDKPQYAGNKRLVKEAKKIYEKQISEKTKLLRKMSDLSVDYERYEDALQNAQDTARIIDKHYKHIGVVADIGGRAEMEASQTKREQYAGQIAKAELAARQLSKIQAAISGSYEMPS